MFVNMEKRKDKRLEDKEKLETEIARSLSVVKMKEAHRQIEDIEKSRKKAIVQSLIERISLTTTMNKELSTGFARAIEEAKRDPEYPKNFVDSVLNAEVNEGGLRIILDSVWQNYESIRFIFKRIIAVKMTSTDVSQIKSRLKKP